MSIDLDVFLERSKLPDLGTWAEAISQEGFPLTFPEHIDLTQHTGFLPTVLGDEESGFEFFMWELDKSDDFCKEVLSLAPEVDTQINFCCHETLECLAASLAAAVLAKLTNGVFLDPQGDEYLRGQDAIALAKTQLDDTVKKEADKIAHGKLTPAKWAEAFEQTLRRVNPNYKPNNDYHGRLVECVREDATGLFLSQNCVKLCDSYRHCFAVLLTCKKLSPALNSPFIFGSRFDHNSTISHAYNRDYRAGKKWQVAPKEWHSEYSATLRGTQQWVETTARTAESVLFPFYFNRIIQGAERVASLYQDATSFLERWGITQELLTAPVEECELASKFIKEFHIDSVSNYWNKALLSFYNALHLADLNGFSGIQLLCYRQNAICTCDDISIGSENYLAVPEEIRNAAIFVRYIDDFLAVKDELPHMIRTIENIRLLHSPASGEKTKTKKPWWQLWRPP